MGCEGYTLNKLSKLYLGEEKLDFDFDMIRSWEDVDIYQTKIKDYNARDVELTEKIH